MAPRDSGTAAYHIFERLNTGGTPLKPQEIRNCVFHGPIVEELNTLNEDSSWRSILGRKKLDKHQRDVEMLLRVFAMFEGLESYEKPMKEFLNKSMQANKNADTQKFRQFKRQFSDVCERIVDAFGDRPFHVRGPINLAAMDSVLAIAFRNTKADYAKLQKKYQSLLEKEEFKDSIFFNTSDAVTVKTRMKAVAKLV